MKALRLFLSFISIWIFSGQLLAGTFLPPDQAFQFKAQQNGNVIDVEWKVEHGYYLYENRMSSYIEMDEANIDLPLSFISKSELKMDKNFGEVPVFYDTAKAIIDITSITRDSPNKTVTIEYQGCAKDGLCYQPQTKTLDVIVIDNTTDVANANPDGSTNPAVVIPAIKAADPIPSFAVAAPQSATNTAIKPSAGPSAEVSEKPALEPAVTPAVETSVNELSSTGDISKFLEHASLLSTIGIFFLLGIGLSLTPCILPMVPILSGIIVGHGHNLTARHGILLSSAYVLGMATSYAFAGIIAATFGAQGNLQAYMQNPWVIVTFSLVFVALSLSMFGLYNLALPSRVQNALYNLSNKQKGGHLIGVFVMGALSALVVSPCVSAPLAGALVFISSTGDKLMGGLALFALGIGMGLPLIAIGAGGGKLVPKAGLWMNHVKHLFGVILLGVAIWLMSRIIPGEITLALWSVLLIAYGMHTGAFEPAAPGFARLGKAASFILVLYGCILMFGALTGGTDPLHPIKLSSQSASETVVPVKAPLFKRIKTKTELTTAINMAAQEHKTVMLDFYADWCTACIDMERKVFSQASVQWALKDFVLLQIDVTDNTADDKTVLDHFKLFGPPSMLFFKNNQQITEKSLQGEMLADEFINHVHGI